MDLIGTGGWAYFKIHDLDSLQAYSRTFNFVEVNSSYYQIPTVKSALNWRSRVPKDFNFALRSHKSIFEGEDSRDISQVELMEHIIQINRLLKSIAVVVTFPKNRRFDISTQNSLSNLLDSVDLDGVQLVFQIDNLHDYPRFSKWMKEKGIIHCVDLSHELPEYKTGITYTRLFGSGIHNIYQFDDQELEKIDRHADTLKSDKKIFSFHGVKMYKDAARFKTYRQTGKFMEVTRSVGMESVKEVLNEDASFPMTKSELISNQGWKVIDLTSQTRIHLANVLSALPEKLYDNVEDVIASLKLEDTS